MKELPQHTTYFQKYKEKLNAQMFEKPYTLTVENYQESFHHLLCWEEKEHMSILANRWELSYIYSSHSSLIDNYPGLGPKCLPLKSQGIETSQWPQVWDSGSWEAKECCVHILLECSHYSIHTSQRLFILAQFTWRHINLFLVKNRACKRKKALL